jgi:glycosyltransferase involved in cell wall biosynthesis
MKILIVMGLADRSLQNHIQPLINLYEIKKIIIRDKPGPILPKVIYYSPPNKISKNKILSVLWKTILLTILAFKEKPDVIHSFLIFPHGLISFISAKISHKKIGISMIAGPLELYSTESPIKKYAYSKTLPPLNFIGKISILILNKINYITVTGTYTKMFLIEKGIPENKIFVLHHFFSENTPFRPQERNKSSDFIYVGRLAKVKHIETLVKASYLVKKTYPNVKILIIGDGEEKKRLLNLTNSLNLTDNMNFIGYQQNVWDYINDSKAMILSSEREGFPMVAIEALLCGVPLISSNCGDINDILKNGYNSIIINDYSNYIDYANAMLLLMKKPELLYYYSKNAYETAKKFDINDVIYQWKQILRL